MTEGPLRYAGPCRVLPANLQDMQGIVTEQELPSMAYKVSISKDVNTVKVRDIVTITACIEDPQIVGQELSVKGVKKGSIRSERVLLCIDDLSN